MVANEPMPSVSKVGDRAEHHRVRSASVLLPRSVPFQEGAKDALVVRPGEDFVSV